MDPLKPQQPFVWPEPRVLLGMAGYEEQPPFAEFIQRSSFLFGIMSALTFRGIDILEGWMDRNKDLKVRLILIVYPACATKQQDLYRLLDLVGRISHRLSIHVHPLERVTDRATNTICCLDSNTDTVHVCTGPSEDFGLGSQNDGQVNFVFRADPILVEGFKRYFDFLWANSRDIAAPGAVLIPDLVLPEGTEEGARLWRNYMRSCDDVDMSEEIPCAVDPETGDVAITDDEGNIVTSPTEDGGLKKLDSLAEFVAQIYGKGSLVSIDKLSRIPPLDTPLDPKVFGDVAELQKGNVTRKVNMRVSILDEKTLREIEKRRQGLRTLLTRFTFALADNMHWMPNQAGALLESELKRISEEGQKLITDLLKGDIEEFINSKRADLISDINAMYIELGRDGQVAEDVIAKVTESLKNRFRKAQATNFLPKLSFSAISFTRTENAMASPWGQAFSLLSDIAAFPRKALTDKYFFSGISVDEDDLIEAMNVADDVLCHDLGIRGIKNRCKAELELLSKIEQAPLEARDRCELVYSMLTGHTVDEIEKTLKEKKEGHEEKAY